MKINNTTNFNLLKRIGLNISEIGVKVYSSPHPVSVLKYIKVH